MNNIVSTVAKVFCSPIREYYYDSSSLNDIKNLEDARDSMSFFQADDGFLEALRANMISENIQYEESKSQDT